MNCFQFRDVMQDLARNEGLDVATLNAALAHADTCGPCDDLLRETEALSADLRALADADFSRQPPARLEAEVLSAYALHKSSMLHAANLRLAAVAALASIAALTLFAIFLVRHPHPAPAPSASSHNGREEAALSVPGDTQSDALFTFEEEGGATGAFVPLTRTFDRTSLEGSAVLRVALSPASLREFGLSPDNAGGQQILADMIVASDGTPEAIRLVGK
jgi:hypothetical protein